MFSVPVELAPAATVIGPLFTVPPFATVSVPVPPPANVPPTVMVPVPFPAFQVELGSVTITVPRDPACDAIRPTGLLNVPPADIVSIPVPVWPMLPPPTLVKVEFWPVTVTMPDAVGLFPSVMVRALALAPPAIVNTPVLLGALPMKSVFDKFQLEPWPVTITVPIDPAAELRALPPITPWEPFSVPPFSIVTAPVPKVVPWAWPTVSCPFIVAILALGPPGLTPIVAGGVATLMSAAPVGTTPVLQLLLSNQLLLVGDVGDHCARADDVAASNAAATAIAIGRYVRAC
jgi:hypothetical protein